MSLPSQPSAWTVARSTLLIASIASCSGTSSRARDCNSHKPGLVAQVNQVALEAGEPLNVADVCASCSGQGTSFVQEVSAVRAELASARLRWHKSGRWLPTIRVLFVNETGRPFWLRKRVYIGPPGDPPESHQLWWEVRDSAGNIVVDHSRYCGRLTDGLPPVTKADYAILESSYIVGITMALDEYPLRPGERHTLKFTYRDKNLPEGLESSTVVAELSATLNLVTPQRPGH